MANVTEYMLERLTLFCNYFLMLSIDGSEYNHLTLPPKVLKHLLLFSNPSAPLQADPSQASTSGSSRASARPALPQGPFPSIHGGRSAAFGRTRHLRPFGSAGSACPPGFLCTHSPLYSSLSRPAASMGFLPVGEHVSRLLVKPAACPAELSAAPSIPASWNQQRCPLPEATCENQFFVLCLAVCITVFCWS